MRFKKNLELGRLTHLLERDNICDINQCDSDRYQSHSNTHGGWGWTVPTPAQYRQAVHRGPSLSLCGCGTKSPPSLGTVMVSGWRATVLVVVHTARAKWRERRVEFPSFVRVVSLLFLNVSNLSSTYLTFSPFFLYLSWRD